MIVTSKLREKFFKYPHLETSIVFSVYLLVGYLLNPDDILILKSKLPLITVIMAIITLFHGISSGVLAIFIMGIAMKFGYSEFLYLDFLRELVLVLIFGEFHYYWNRQIYKQSVEGSFTKTKLKELSKSFYMLKISHDQIEESYILKPMSLRNSIKNIKQYFVDGFEEKCYDSFLQLLQKNFNVERSYLATLESDDTLNVLSQTHNDTTLNADDLMVKSAIEKKVPIYVSSSDEYSGSQYLAVMPIIIDDEMRGLFVIEKMPFLSFNKDTLISVLILTTYLYNELNKITTLKEIEDFLPGFDNSFQFEMYQYYNMSKIHDVRSTVLIFKSTDELKIHVLYDEIKKGRRGIEVLERFATKDMVGIILLFPITGKMTISGFVNRMFNLMHYENDGTVKYASFDVNEMSMIREYVGDVQWQK